MGEPSFVMAASKLNDSPLVQSTAIQVACTANANPRSVQSFSAAYAVISYFFFK